MLYNTAIMSAANFERSGYTIGTIRNPGQPNHGKPALFIPAGTELAATLDASDAAAAADRRASRTNNEPRGTIAHATRRVDIALAMASERAATEATPRQATALGHLSLEAVVLHQLPTANLPAAVEYTEKGVHQGNEMLARVRTILPDADHSRLAARIAAEESVLGRLIEELPYHQQ